jgi:hypothetical protein
MMGSPSKLRVIRKVAVLARVRTTLLFDLLSESRAAEVELATGRLRKAELLKLQKSGQFPCDLYY